MSIPTSLSEPNCQPSVKSGNTYCFMGNAAEDKAAQSPFDVLNRPFADNDILRILNKES